MKHYMIRLSYTADAWKEIIDISPNLKDRLDNIVKLIQGFGGSLANYHFFEGPYFDSPDKHHVVICKFVPFGEYDIVTIVALPDDVTARTMNAVIAAEPGVKSIELTPMIPLEDTLQGIAKGKSVKQATTYSAPGTRP